MWVLSAFDCSFLIPIGVAVHLCLSSIFKVAGPQTICDAFMLFLFKSVLPLRKNIWIYSVLIAVMDAASFPSVEMLAEV